METQRTQIIEQLKKIEVKKKMPLLYNYMESAFGGVPTTTALLINSLRFQTTTLQITTCYKFFCDTE